MIAQWLMSSHAKARSLLAARKSANNLAAQFSSRNFRTLQDCFPGSGIRPFLGCSSHLLPLDLTQHAVKRMNRPFAPQITLADYEALWRHGRRAHKSDGTTILYFGDFNGPGLHMVVGWNRKSRSRRRVIITAYYPEPIEAYYHHVITVEHLFPIEAYYWEE
jgi:hypothetical protein